MLCKQTKARQKDLPLIFNSRASLHVWLGSSWDRGELVFRHKAYFRGRPGLQAVVCNRKLSGLLLSLCSSLLTPLWLRADALLQVPPSSTCHSPRLYVVSCQESSVLYSVECHWPWKIDYIYMAATVWEHNSAMEDLVNPVLILEEFLNFRPMAVLM